MASLRVKLPAFIDAPLDVNSLIKKHDDLANSRCALARSNDELTAALGEGEDADFRDALAENSRVIEVLDRRIRDVTRIRSIVERCRCNPAAPYLMFVAESEWTPADEADYRQGVRSLFAAASGGAAGGITAATDADAVALLDETAERQPEHSVFARSTAIASAPTESTDSTAESAGTVTNARLGEEAGDSGIHL